MRIKGWILSLIGVVIFTISISSAVATNWEESDAIGAIFKNAAINGTFVLYDVTADRYIGYDKTRAERRYIPASTFKIPNSLIGLSTGAVKSVDEVLPYKSDSPPLKKEWTRDMGLREAIAMSNVPIYKELARRIGFERMKEGITRIDYGNNETGNSVDSFWLEGPLAISAVEQTRFLAKLAQQSLPFPESCQKSVREIILLGKGENWKLYGKTGWENATNPGIGWWVGWVEKDGRIYAFALNMDMQKLTEANKRIELGKASLKALGII